MALHRCIVRGGRAGEDADGKIGAWAGYAGEGARVQGDTEFVAIYSLFQGGDGGDGGDFIGKSCSAGGTGLIVDSPAIARELACIFEAGTGGVWVNAARSSTATTARRPWAPWSPCRGRRAQSSARV